MVCVRKGEGSKVPFPPNSDSYLFRVQEAIVIAGGVLQSNLCRGVSRSELRMSDYEDNGLRRN